MKKINKETVRDESLLKKYYRLTKPGIVRGNTITAAAGFFLAAQGSIDFLLLLSTLFGSALVIASACVFNNYLDRNIDAKMARTQKRALVTGDISYTKALVFGSILGLTGFTILFTQTTILTTLAALIGFVFYVVVYGYAKRKSVHGTLVGTIPGALPLVGGYLAVTNQVDSATVLLFAIMVCWQMPHFYAIGIYRLKDYVSAGIPVLPAVKGIAATKKNMVGYTIGFVLACTALFVLGYAGYTYLIVITLVGLIWLKQSIYGLTVKDDVKWAKKFFGTSLIVLLTFSVLISITTYLP